MQAVKEGVLGIMHWIECTSRLYSLWGIISSCEIFGDKQCGTKATSTDS